MLKEWCQQCGRPLTETEERLCSQCEMDLTGLPPSLPVPVNANRRQKASLALWRAQQGVSEAVRQLEGTDLVEPLCEVLTRMTRIKERLGK